jgi:hypothetical protein
MDIKMVLSIVALFLICAIPGCLQKEKKVTVDADDINMEGSLWNLSFLLRNDDPEIPELHIKMFFNDKLRIDHVLNFTTSNNTALGQYGFTIHLPEGRYDVDVKVSGSEETSSFTFFAAGDLTMHPLYLISYEPKTDPLPGLNIAYVGMDMGDYLSTVDYEEIPMIG